MATPVDFWDIGLFADGIPHDVLRALRHNEPVAGIPSQEADSGFWSLTRYDDVVRVSRDSETFSSQQRGIMMFDTFIEGTPDDARMMIDLDPPLHTRYRRLVNRGFTPRTVERLEPLMRTDRQAKPSASSTRTRMRWRPANGARWPTQSPRTTS